MGIILSRTDISLPDSWVSKHCSTENNVGPIYISIGMLTWIESGILTTTFSKRECIKNT
eukprot:Awhi_evm1s4293